MEAGNSRRRNLDNMLYNRAEKKHPTQTEVTDDSTACEPSAAPEEEEEQEEDILFPSEREGIQ